MPKKKSNGKSTTTKKKSIVQKNDKTTGKRPIKKKKKKKLVGLMRKAVLQRHMKSLDGDVVFSKAYLQNLYKLINIAGEKIVGSSVKHTESLDRVGLTSSSLKYGCKSVIQGKLSQLCTNQIKNK